MLRSFSSSFFFFFQAEDGIRDLYVTGVQTCALPILPVICFRKRPREKPAGMIGEVRRERMEIRGKPAAVSGKACRQVEVCGRHDEVSVVSLGFDPRDERCVRTNRPWRGKEEQTRHGGDGSGGAQASTHRERLFA